MSQVFFRILLLLAGLIRLPLSVILIIFKNISGPLQRRFAFERKNFVEDECRSFKKEGLVADFCFEVSSEGELEQVRPVIEIFLQEKKKIELIFASPSVEAKCLKMARDYKNQLRVFRLPIATHLFLFQTPAKWISAPVVIFCRYDFFPELLSLIFYRKKFVLLSASAKKVSWFKKEVYKLFDIIVAANIHEATYFLATFPEKKNFAFDFRVPRIFLRIEGAENVLREKKQLQSYLHFLQQKPKNSRLILGSAWASDLVIFNDPSWIKAIKEGRVHLLVVPHDLKKEAIKEMKEALEKIFIDVPIFEMSPEKNEFNGFEGIVLLNMSGVLCELYTYFESSYVGGGFARSIHSVLEPFLSGARVYCGPKVHRSTEYDFVKAHASDEIHLLNNPESFYNLFIEKKEHAPNALVREMIKRNLQKEMKAILTEIEHVK